jgi:DNA recombination protein RmuC
MELVISFIFGSVLAIIIGYFILRYINKNQEEHFKLIANDIMKKQSDEFNEIASQKINQSIDPLQLKIKEYRDYYEQMQRFDLKERESLREKLSQMMESASRIENEASYLTNALTSDVKFQGAWGELTLNNILELAGLEKNREYFLQESLQDADGNKFRPDVVIHLPNNSKVIIDSKVSLTAYFDYCNKNDNEEALKNLKASVQTHIDSLSKKNYQNLEGVNSPNFVYLFIPVEGVYSLVLREYPEILDYALRKNIVLVSPVNLIANLKTVASIWRLEKQSQNAEDVARKAGAMYDKFVSLLDDMGKLSGSIQKTQSIHDGIMTKLSTGKGNLITRTEELKSLGAKTTKNINEEFLN